MDTRTGKIYTSRDTFEGTVEEGFEFLKQMEVKPTMEQLKRGKIGRNDPCPCGSRSKFKKCCMFKLHMGSP